MDIANYAGAARRQVEDATVKILGIHGAGTAFAVRYHGEDSLVTASHVTNYYFGTLGIVYQGKSYFPVFKGDQLAFAELIAFNPQGGGCNGEDDHLDPRLPFTDLSLLRILSPAQTRDIIRDITAGGSDLSGVLDDIFHSQPYNAAQLAAHTDGFAAKPIIVNDSTPPAQQGDRTLSIAYYHNKPDRVAGRVVATNGHMFAIATTPGHTLPGHSGSLLYRSDDGGHVIPEGIMVGGTASNHAFLSGFSEVIRGLRTVTSGEVLPQADMEKICTPPPGLSVWFSANHVTGTPVPASR